MASFNKFNLYANEICIIIDAKSFVDVYDKANDIISKICVWFKTNKLKVNIEKSNYMNFSPNEPSDNFTVGLQDNFLMKVKAVKYLGIYIQNNLKWVMLIDTTIKSLFKLKHLFQYLSHYILISISFCYFIGLWSLVV